VGAALYSPWEDMCYQPLFNSNNLATAEALVEACALLSVILVNVSNSNQYNEVIKVVSNIILTFKLLQLSTDASVISQRVWCS